MFPSASQAFFHISPRCVEGVDSVQPLSGGTTNPGPGWIVLPSTTNPASHDGTLETYNHHPRRTCKSHPPMLCPTDPHPQSIQYLPRLDSTRPKLHPRQPAYNLRPSTSIRDTPHLPLTSHHLTSPHLTLPRPTQTLSRNLHKLDKLANITPTVLITNNIHHHRHSKTKPRDISTSTATLLPVPYSPSYQRYSRASRPSPLIIQSEPPTHTTATTRRPRSHSPATMCKTNIYTEISSSGRRREYEELEFCKRSRHGVLCDRDTVYRHEPTYSASLSPKITYNSPPTPPRSSHSRGGSDSGASTKRRSSTYYTTGDRYIEVPQSSTARSRSRRNSFAVEFEEPVVTYSPPRRNASMRRTAPPSPQLNDDLFQVSDPKQLQDMVDGPRGILKGGARRSSRASHASDEERYLGTRRVNDLFINTKEDQARAARRDEQIKRQNRDIESRPIHVPDAPVMPNSRSYRRPSVVVDPTTEVISRMHALDMKDQRRQEKRDRLAEEEQEQRLRDRMAPRRSNMPTTYYVEPVRGARY